LRDKTKVTIPKHFTDNFRGKALITIDGSFGEGGGQIIRTSLGLSLVTRKPFRIERIRAKRKNPGLQRQHLTAVTAAAKIGNAEAVEGATLGSSALSFKPKEVARGEYEFDIGTAGSTALVLQTVLPALLVADGPTVLHLEGGTHNPLAPPFDFLQKAFLPLLEKMGAKIESELIRPGFYPAGGGQAVFTIDPPEKLSRLDLDQRGEVRSCKAKASVANLPLSIAERELKTIGKKLGWSNEFLQSEQIKNSKGPGNVVSIEIETEHLTEVFTGFGQKGVSAETVASGVAKEAQSYLNSEAAVGEYLTDQLLLPLALAGGGSFTTGPLSDHTITNIEVIKKFLDVSIRKFQISEDLWRIEIG
jgi:RNA 3'-terminal phosphate cyclase (ATP)